jgi:hypothetical protein
MATAAATRIIAFLRQKAIADICRRQCARVAVLWPRCRRRAKEKAKDKAKEKEKEPEPEPEPEPEATDGEPLGLRSGGSAERQI